jgi:hypothetical protein
MSKDTTLHKRWRVVFAVVLLLQLTGVAVFSQASNQQAEYAKSPYFDQTLEHVKDENQYDHLADALLSGHLNLDLPVSNVLTALPNPYDTTAREAANATAQTPIYWDYAYYNGNYYCYFGVLPCLLAYVPFKLITGMDLRTDFALVGFAWLFTFAGLLLVYELWRTYFKKVPPGMLLIGYLALWLGSGLLEQVFLPRIYEVASTAALAFAVLGVALWLHANRRGQMRDTGPMRRWLVLGSLCVAATLACRPQFMLCFLLALPIFWDELVHTRWFFSRKGWTHTLAIIVPFIVVAVPVMWYNAARFSSPFDFGATYNLTGSDMTQKHTSALMYVAYLALYLFLPPLVQSNFPGIHMLNEQVGQYTLMGTETYYMGFFCLTPIALLVFYSIWRHRALRKQGVRGLVGMGLICAFIILSADIVVSGLNMRYFADFGWLVMIGAICGMWVLYERVQPKHRIFLGAACIALLAIGLGLDLWSFLGTERIGALIYSNPALYDAAQWLVLR